jgi:hypothetical protein
MACVSQSQVPRLKPIPELNAPHSRLAAHLIEHHYDGLGCNGWNSRKVKLLMAKLCDTPIVFAARMRIRPFELNERLERDEWTKQDGFILTILEREIDFLRGGVSPERPMLASSPQPENPT